LGLITAPMLCHARGPKLKLRRKTKNPPKEQIETDSSIRDSGIIYDDTPSTDASDKSPAELDKPLLSNKYTARDKSLRLNHGGWDRNDKDEKDFSEPVYPSIREVLRLPGPYPQTIRSSYNDFWFQGFHDQSPISWLGDKILEAVSSPEPPEIDQQCEETTFRKHYIGQEHLNFYGRDEEHGPIIMSIKVEEEQYRVIIRCRDGNFERRFDLKDQENNGPLVWARSIIPNLNVKTTRFYPVLCINAWQRILTFDEHANMKKNHKFAVFLQQHGQTTEDELLGNSTESQKFKDFLNALGTTVKLADHKGFRGGLNLAGGADGEHSLYTKFDQREIMFHVSTMLPTDKDDKQQVAKKRHLGNDVVAIVFQERNTPFCPSLMQTKVTHCYVVVQPMEVEGPTQYKISVCCRKDVPEFGPKLPEPPVFKSGPTFRQFLLCKLINAETACYSSSDFHMLRRRNRSDLIETLHDELSTASDGLSTRKSWIQRPLQTNKSFFDALQASQKIRRSISNSSENSSDTSDRKETKSRIIRRSGIRRELHQKYQQKVQDSGISSRDSSSSGHDSNLDEISDAVTEKDMESLKSEMLSDRDNDDKISRCDSIANSIGNISSRLTSLTLQSNKLVVEDDFQFNRQLDEHFPKSPEIFATSEIFQNFQYQADDTSQFTEISDISSVISSVFQSPPKRKIPGAVPMPHMQQW